MSSVIHSGSDMQAGNAESTPEAFCWLKSVWSEGGGPPLQIGWSNPFGVPGSTGKVAACTFQAEDS